MFKVSQVDFPNKRVLQSLNIAFIMADSADRDEMQQTMKLLSRGFRYTKDLFPNIRQVQYSKSRGSETARSKAFI